MGRSAIGERQREIKYCCKIVEIRIMEAICNMTFHVCSFQNYVIQSAIFDFVIIKFHNKNIYVVFRNNLCLNISQ